jgi:hypothetical protein
VADVDALVLTTVNAPWRSAIDTGTLLACLLGQRDPGRWLEHVRTFFEDVPREAIFRFMLAHDLSPGRLLTTHRRLFAADEQHHDGLATWLAELADAA